MIVIYRDKYIILIYDNSILIQYNINIYIVNDMIYDIKIVKYKFIISIKLLS